MTLVSKTSTFGVLLTLNLVLAWSSAIASWMLLWVVLMPTFINKKMLSFILAIDKRLKIR